MVCLHLLCGLLLEETRGVLRAGTGILRTIDFLSAEEIDALVYELYGLTETEIAIVEGGP